MTLEQDLLHRDTSEKSVLGAISVDNSIIDEISHTLKPHMFSGRQNRWVYEAMLSLRESSVEINASTIFQEVVKMGKADSMTAYEVTTCLPYTSPSQALYFAATIADTHMKSEVVKLGERLIAKAKTDTSDGFELVESGMTALEGVLGATGSGNGATVSFSDLLGDMYIEMDNHEEGTLSGVPSGLSSLDDVTNGFQKGNLIIIAGRPAQGKSALVTTIINNAASQGFPCALFSLEMSKREVGARLSSSYTRIGVQDINKKRLFSDQKQSFKNTMDGFKDLPIYVNDSTDLSIAHLKSQARQLVRVNGVKMIVIDYLQLMKGSGNVNSREQEISEISRSLKNLAKELDIPIIALSQLSRAVENRPIPRPQLSDLRESGAIEQDANIVMFLYRPEYYSQMKGEEVHPDDRGLAQVIIGKNRDGELGDIDLNFIGEYSLFLDREINLKS